MTAELTVLNIALFSSILAVAYYIFEPHLVNIISVIKTNTKKTMTTLSFYARTIADEDTKKLVKAELLNEELNITSTGREALMSLLLDKHKKEMVALADEIINENK